ncbi:hypothetical protein [Endozoicomonas sp. SCSIO W0465]|uniref:hypothetical protein n=1 Tax=Endozoicomonas sp. SCSIO W0465 TaxID=2918516 RepID=UPI002075055C|nr:hypothetical protein [Endozoicomonas sp. SCSIO W0465]USE37290.1 hypothetical protein MJO57_03425 [Endozoicomonas sp. SCSIO W0465]
MQPVQRYQRTATIGTGHESEKNIHSQQKIPGHSIIKHQVQISAPCPSMITARTVTPASSGLYSIQTDITPPVFKSAPIMTENIQASTSACHAYKYNNTGIPVELVRMLIEHTQTTAYVYHGSFALHAQNFDVKPNDIDILCSMSSAMDLLSRLTKEPGLQGLISSKVIPGIEQLGIPEQISISIADKNSTGKTLIIQLNIIDEDKIPGIKTKICTAEKFDHRGTIYIEDPEEKVRFLTENNQKFLTQYLQGDYHKNLPTTVSRSLLFNSESSDEARQFSVMMRALMAAHQSKNAINTFEKNPDQAIKFCNQDSMETLKQSRIDLIKCLREHVKFNDFLAAITARLTSMPKNTEFAQKLLEPFNLEHLQESQTNKTRVIMQNHPAPEGCAGFQPVDPGNLQHTATRMPDIDVTKLSPMDNSRDRKKMDPDMKLLFLNHLPLDQSHKKGNSNDYFLQIQRNQHLHNDTSIPNYDKRQQIITSLTKYMHKNSTYKMMKDEEKKLPDMMKTNQSREAVKNSKKTCPDHCIYLCIAPSLPFTANVMMRFSTKFLPEYCIPSFSTQSLLSISQKHKVLKDAFGADNIKELSGSHLQPIVYVFEILDDTFHEKVKKLANSTNENKSEVESDLLLHSKFITHITLIALLHFQRDVSLDNAFIFSSIFYYMLTHIKTSRTVYAITKAPYFELVRGLLTMLSHDTIKEEIAPIMLGMVKRTTTEESLPAFNFSRQEQQKERLRKKLQDRKDKHNSYEDMIINMGNHVAALLQEELVHILICSFKKMDLTPYYLATFDTVSDLPIFSPKISKNQRIYQEFRNHLLGLIHFMIDNTQKMCHWNADVVTSRKFIESVEAWHPRLNQLLATLAGWQPGHGEKTTYNQWPSMALNKHKNGEQPLPPDLLPLIEDSIQLKKETIIKKLEEDKSIRQFEQDADCWAKQIDELNKKKVKKLAKPYKEQQSKKSTSLTMTKESPEQNSGKSPEQKAEGTTGLFFADKVVNYCRGIDFTKDFETLQAKVPEHMDRELGSDGDRLFLYTEMAFQCFHANRQRIAMTSVAMRDATSTYKKLTSALSTPKREFTNRRQSTEWLARFFSSSELSPKKLLRLSLETTVERLEDTRKSLDNALSLFRLAVEPGLELIQAMEEPDFIFRGKLPLKELILHFDMCRDAMKLLTYEFREPLNYPIITHELPDLKKKLFEQLRFYGPNSFKSIAHIHSKDPSYESAMAALKQMEDDKEKYCKYNQSAGSTEKTETDELLNKFIQIDNGLKSFYSKTSGVSTVLY